MLIKLILCSILGYIIGGIPSGIIIGRVFGEKDLRKKGSRNIGATNVLRVVGLLPALITLLFDSLKGCLPLLILKIFHTPLIYLIFCGMAVILGHDFSPYLKFKGGKGVATSLGVFILLSPKAILISVSIWIVTLLLFKIVSVSSIIAAISLPIAIFLFNYQRPLLCAGIIASILLIIRHKENIARLFRGEEKRIKRLV